MDTCVEFLERISLIGPILAVSACAEVQQSFRQSDGLTEETTAILPLEMDRVDNAETSAGKSRVARLEADDDDIPVTGVRLAASSNNGNGASNGGGLVSQNSPPLTKVATETSMPAGNGGSQIVSQAGVDLNPSKLLNRGGGITSQQKPTFTSP